MPALINFNLRNALQYVISQIVVISEKYVYKIYVLFCLKFFICNLAAWLLRGQSLIHSILAASSVAVVFGSELTTGREKRNAVFADFSTSYYGGTLT